MSTWYTSLNKPPLTPPDWIFGPVWMVLYVIILISIVLYYRAPNKDQVRKTTALIVIHLLTNAVWTPLFFALHAPGWALLDIIALVITLFYLLRRFFEVSYWAGSLLLPYLFWVTFATYLNFGIWKLN